MAKILRFDLVSVAILGAALYALLGFIAFTCAGLGDHSLVVPLGLLLPAAHADFTITLTVNSSWVGDAAALAFCLVGFAATGAISCVFLAGLYNLTSRFWTGLKAITAETPQPSPVEKLHAVI